VSTLETHLTLGLGGVVVVEGVAATVATAAAAASLMDAIAVSSTVASTPP
jgi:hypothetical protein